MWNVWHKSIAVTVDAVKSLIVLLRMGILERTSFCWLRAWMNLLIRILFIAHLQVHLIGHIPPSQTLHSWGYNFYNILNRSAEWSISRWCCNHFPIHTCLSSSVLLLINCMLITFQVWEYYCRTILWPHPQRWVHCNVWSEKCHKTY